MMASTVSSSLRLSSSSSAIIENKPASRPSAALQPTFNIPTLPAPPLQNRAAKAVTHCHKVARNVAAMATGEAAPAEVVPAAELPEIFKTLQDTWDKVEDKYAVSSLSVAAVGAVWVSAGAISAVDRIPLVPGVLEIVGIGYTGWFAYRNLIFKPEREALIQKVKETYKNILGSS